MEIYAETFRRQVYGADQDGKVIQESLEVTKGHGAMVRRPPLSLSIASRSQTNSLLSSSETSASTSPSSSTVSSDHSPPNPLSHYPEKSAVFVLVEASRP